MHIVDNDGNLIAETPPQTSETEAELLASAPTLKARVKRLERILSRCVCALDQEISANSDDAHPIIEAHRHVSNEARQVLSQSAKEGK